MAIIVLIISSGYHLWPLKFKAELGHNPASLNYTLEERTVTSIMSRARSRRNKCIATPHAPGTLLLSRILYININPATLRLCITVTATRKLARPLLDVHVDEDQSPPTAGHKQRLECMNLWVMNSRQTTASRPEPSRRSSAQTQTRSRQRVVANINKVLRLFFAHK